ncbi:MAG: ATP-binding cassette domain-containing protein [Saprospiraceae bacterium]|nr:ATP-binding cassette domain-containing protein [Saprospiraceae bacterium]
MLVIGLDIKNIIELKNANIQHEENIVLENINLVIKEAEFSYLVGDTGSGKSSLLKTIYGDLPLFKGYGLVLDQDLSELNYKNKYIFRRKMGMIFQNFNLINNWTVYQNLDYSLRALDWPDKEIRNKRIKEIVFEIGLAKKLNNKIFELSGGEQQRVAIGRALLNKPELLIADEPTGNLDINSTNELMYLLKRIATENQTAVLFATHDYKIIEKFPALTYLCKDRKLLFQD